jgi:serine/threonine protein kinase
VELVHIDLECRLKAGEVARVEDYLRRYPELTEQPDAGAALASAEYRLRRRSEPGLTLTEYLRRFPHYRRRLADVARTLPVPESSAAAGAGPTAASTAAAPASAPAEGDAAAAEWPEVSGYRILGELGRGGMGVVYQAWQESLDRPVALKVILAREHAGPEERRRFRAEAEAIARLQHPNIVQVFEVGEHRGLPYFAMELVDGTTLATEVGGRLASPRQAAEQVATLAQAVEHAHQRGVVHRDLKPANVLVTPDGALKITDFGLAKRLDREAAQTQSGALLGTPSYMAPEQAGGRSKAVGPATDVYALGAILYELLTSSPPFRAETALDTLMQVMSEAVVPPARLRPDCPRALEAICLKCLRKKPAERYASAAALEEDLRRFLRGKCAGARPTGRRAPWLHRVVLVLVGILAAAALAVFVRGMIRHAGVVEGQDLSAPSGKESGSRPMGSQAASEASPIVNKEVEGQRVSIYNERTHPSFPVLGLRLKNTSGLRLMQGPITVFEGSSYAGDSRILDVQPDEERLLPYAVDLGTEVEAVAGNPRHTITKLKALKGSLYSTTREVEGKTYHARNRSDRDRTLLIEHPYRPDFRLTSKDRPAERARDVYRFELKVPAGQSASETVTEERDVVNQLVLTNADDDSIRFFLRLDVASPEVKEALRQALELKGKADRARQELAHANQQLADIERDQARIRRILKETPAGAEAYKKYLAKLGSQEFEVDRLRDRIRNLLGEELAQRKAYEDFLAALDVE